MERIDYETYTHRANALRTQAIAGFSRGIARTLAASSMAPVRAYHRARRALAGQLNTGLPTARTC